jgi:hypothetical protein
MTVSAIFSECSYLFWVEVAKILSKENGWRPCYWIASPKLKQAVKEAFPNVVFHSNLDAVRGIVPRDCGGLKLAALDQRLLQDLSFHESIALRMMDRMDPGRSFSYQERIRLYHFLIKYWLSVLTRFNADIVVFPTSPHLIYDYILYVLCQKIGVKTAMFERTSIRGLIFPLERFENGSDAIRSMYNKELARSEPRSVKLSSIAEEHTNKLSGAYSGAIPFYLKEQLEKQRTAVTFDDLTLNDLKRKSRVIMKYSHFILSALKNYYTLILNNVPPNYLKQARKKIENSQMTSPEYQMYKIKANMKKRQFLHYYNKLTGNISLDESYLFVALQYQPERTTSPNGGVFANQLLMIDLLSKSIPRGWYLYVKEHISQFQPYKRGHLSRTIDFYDDVVSLPNVKVVPLSMSPFDLIDNAKVVATVTGTPGWEAVMRGKPALVFGHAWYRDCEGVFYTPTEKSCKEALCKIEAGYEVDREKVRLFIYVLEQVCFRGYFDPALGKAARISNEENVRAIAKALQNLCKS